MDDRCRHCNGICKRLDASDQPLRYCFGNLPPAKVIEILDFEVKHYSGKLLRLKQSAISSGNQLAVLMESRLPGAELEFLGLTNVLDHCLVFVCQAEASDSRETTVFIRYGTPEACCASNPLVMELTALIEHLIARLYAIDSGRSTD
jgi:hypothetical protein